MELKPGAVAPWRKGALAPMLLAYITLAQLMKTWLIRRFGLS